MIASDIEWLEMAVGKGKCDGQGVGMGVRGI